MVEGVAELEGGECLGVAFELLFGLLGVVEVEVDVA